MTINFSGKQVLITGATGQLGRVMVRTFADCGADVVIHYNKNVNMAESLLSELKEKGRRALIVSGDITNKDSVNQMKQTVVAKMGLPHIIINNAVAQYNWKNLLEQDIADFEGQFYSCVIQGVLMAKAFLPGMIERNYGRFIGINTECAMLNDSGSSAYTSAKRGMDGIYRVLAKEVGRYNITVNQIAPGWTISDRERKTGKIAAGADDIPLKRRGTDQEVANAAVFLASDLASYITGVFLPVCGGHVMPSI